MKSKRIYTSLDMTEHEIRLFPDDHLGGTASSTECTGLIMNIPTTEAQIIAYDSLCSYRQEKPIINTLKK